MSSREFLVSHLSPNIISRRMDDPTNWKPSGGREKVLYTNIEISKPIDFVSILDHRVAAIDSKNLTGNIAACFGGKE